MPELHPASAVLPLVAESRACLTCGERIRIQRAIIYGGRVVEIECRVCHTRSLYQFAWCMECGADVGHREECSFATLWGV